MSQHSTRLRCGLHVQSDGGRQFRHHQSGTHPFTRYITHNDPDVRLRQLDNVVEVSTHMLGRGIMRMELQAMYTGQLVRQETLLNPPRHLQIGLKSLLHQ